MEIRYRLTEEDYINFNLFHVRNSKAAQRTLNMQRFVTPIIFPLLAYVFSKIGNLSLLGLLTTFFIMGLLWIVFYPNYFYRVVARNAKRMIRDGNNEGLVGEHHLVMTEEGVVDSTSCGETKVSWSGIKDFKESEGYFYLYNSAVSACIIPKRDVEDVEETRTYIQSQLAQTNKL
ncbi:YcxB family protein [Anoxybacteroides tepidamans]|uniref:YcxB family protein n=1 Tax=Anoxybacteroides tepidamans TaxID=265948 RepID=UPI0004805AAD|nr:YcxB family protein [Anoxybacillus tepidamans]